MNGYVRNKSGSWIHALKRSIAPNEKIQLSELYDIYGKKHGLPDNEEFAAWLKSVKLKDALRWEICYIPDGKEDAKQVPPKHQEAEDRLTPIPKNMTVEDVVMLSFRKAYTLLPKIHDVKLLKHALSEASRLTGKDSLCRIIRKRIDALERMR